MAPLEEVTGYVFRNAYHAHFYPFDKYFAPFVAAKEQKGRLFNYKERNDILPENNRGILLIPQILTNNSEAFIRTARGMREYGYEEINLNLGCPSKTVVNGGRGSGFLQDREGLRKFLDEIFEQLDMKISIKTRLGRYEPEEIGPLMEIFNGYPLEELIIHPRIQKDFYKYTPRMECYRTAYETSRHSLCYNGDLFSTADFQKLCHDFPLTEKVMLGRGVLQNPWLIGMLRSTDPASSENLAPADKELLRAFCEDLCAGYARVISGDKNVLFKLKALWIYLGTSFTNPQKYLKKIKKSQHFGDYEAAVMSLFGEQEILKV